MNTNFWQEYKLSYTKVTQLKPSNLFEPKIRVADYLHLAVTVGQFILSLMLFSSYSMSTLRLLLPARETKVY